MSNCLSRHLSFVAIVGFWATVSFAGAQPVGDSPGLSLAYTYLGNEPSDIVGERVDSEKKEAVVEGMPKYVGGDSLFNINAILEFYSR